MSMHIRLARKIVGRVTYGKVKPSSYTVEQVKEAFDLVPGATLTDEMLLPWTDYEAFQKAEQEKIDRATERNRVRKQKNLERLEQKRKAREKKRQDAIAASDEQHDVAVDAAKQTFDAAMKGAKEIELDFGDDTKATVEQPGFIEDEPEATVIDESLTVAQLKAIAKEWGIKVPSKSRKADIIELLTGAQK